MKSLIIAARWMNPATQEPRPGEVGTGIASPDTKQVLRIRVIEFDGHYDTAMDAALGCNAYKGKPLLRDDETLCNTIPVPA